MKMSHPGLLEMPAADYHASAALGHSSLLKLLRSPEHYQYYRNTPHEPTSSMALGTAVHAAILEPEKFQQEFVVSPKFDRRTKEGKEKAAEFEESAIGKTLIDESTFAIVQQMVSKVSQHSGASKRLARGAAELSGFWTCPETGVQCKFRPDWLVMNEFGEVEAILDVKTTKDASIAGFSKSIANFNYDVQAAFYSDGLKQILGKEVPFLFLAVESDAPHSVAMYQADQQMLEIGRKKYRAGLMLMNWCQENKQWPGYQTTDEVDVISLPVWSVKGAAAFDIE